MNVLRAAVLYFLAVYGVGFLLGMIRVLWWTIEHPPERYILVEIPILLLFAWFICGVVVRHRHVAADVRTRLCMGALAFALLMACELWVGWVFGRLTPIDYLHSLGYPINALVLASQVLFGGFPLLRHLLGRG